MKTSNRHVFKTMLSGVAVGCLVGASAVAQVQIPNLINSLSPNIQYGGQLHWVQHPASERLEIQSFLQVLGLYRGQIDGVWDRESDRALNEFLELGEYGDWITGFGGQLSPMGDLGNEAHLHLRAAAERYQQGGVSVLDAIRMTNALDEEVLEARREYQDALDIRDTALTVWSLGEDAEAQGMENHAVGFYSQSEAMQRDALAPRLIHRIGLGGVSRRLIEATWVGCERV